LLIVKHAEVVCTFCMRCCLSMANDTSCCPSVHRLRRHPDESLGIALQVVLDTLEFGSKIKKTPVVVGNCTGFAVNRVFFPYTQAGISTLQACDLRSAACAGSGTLRFGVGRGLARAAVGSH